MAITTPLTLTRFQGAIESGITTGNPNTHTRAAASMVRYATVSAASSANIMLPGDATNIQFRLIITAGSAGQTSKVQFGNLNDAAHFGTFNSVSAAGLYNIPNVVSAQSLLTQVGTDNLLIVRGSSTNLNQLGRAIVEFTRGPSGG